MADQSRAWNKLSALALLNTGAESLCRVTWLPGLRMPAAALLSHCQIPLGEEIFSPFYR